MTDETEIKSEEKKEETLPEMVDRLEKANKEAKEILARNEQLAARNILGGKSLAGEQVSLEPKEDTPKDYAKKVLKGEIKFN